MDKGQSFQQMVLEHLYNYIWNNEPQSPFHTILRNLRWNIDLNVKLKITWFLEESMKEYLCNIRQRFLRQGSRTLAKKKSSWQTFFIQFKNFHFSKDTVMKMSQQATDWEKSKYLFSECITNSYKSVLKQWQHHY